MRPSWPGYCASLGSALHFANLAHSCDIRCHVTHVQCITGRHLSVSPGWDSSDNGWLIGTQMGQAGDKLYRRKTWVTVTPAHRGMSVPGGPVCCLMQTPVRDGVMEGDWETTCLDLPRPGQECSVVTRAVWGQHYNITPLHHSDSDIGAESRAEQRSENWGQWLLQRWQEVWGSVGAS